jgi:hypothetical protein
VSHQPLPRPGQSADDAPRVARGGGRQVGAPGATRCPSQRLPEPVGATGGPDGTESGGEGLAASYGALWRRSEDLTVDRLVGRFVSGASNSRSAEKNLRPCVCACGAEAVSAGALFVGCCVECCLFCCVVVVERPGALGCWDSFEPEVVDLGPVGGL